jgi:predicted ester cyclase
LIKLPAAEMPSHCSKRAPRHDRSMAPSIANSAPTDFRDFYVRYLRCCNEHRFDELDAFVHDPVVVNGDPVGLDAYVSGLKAAVAAFHDYHWQVQHLLINEPWLVAHLHDTGTHTGTRWGVAATGTTIATQEFALYRLHDAKIAEVWVTADDLHVLRQLEEPRERHPRPRPPRQD